MPKAVSDSKPILFFTANDTDKSWRLKEKIVAVIESYFQDVPDPFTYSSARVKDVIDSLEEVDVAYADMSNADSFFSFVEVRDREESVGRQYVQEIIGKRRSLRIETCRIVSTKGFTRDAVRLAHYEGIQLRLLIPEPLQSIKCWFRPDVIPVCHPCVRLLRCSVLVEVAGRIRELRAEESVIQENKILVPTGKSNEHKAISLSRVFCVDVMRDDDHSDKVLNDLPFDSEFHKLPPIAIEYEKPRLFVKIKWSRAEVRSLTLKETGIFPIRGIVFFGLGSRVAKPAKVIEVYRYVDPIDRAILAEVVLATVFIGEQSNYICLVRYGCDGETYQIGGAFFK